MTPQQPANYLDQGSGAYLRSQLDAMKNGVYAKMVSGDHTKAWDTDQLALQRKINDLAEQSNSGVDPESLTGADEFEHLTLEQIRDLTGQIKPDVVQAVSESWAKIGQSLDEASKTLNDSLSKTLANNWQGEAGGKAAKKIGDFLKASTDIGNSASMVGMKVAFAQRGSDETSRMLGPVLSAALPSAPNPQVPGVTPLKTPTPGTAASLVPTMAGVQSAESEKEETRQASLQVLRSVYAPAMHGGDQGVPVLPSVQQSANPGGPVGPNPVAPGSNTPPQNSPGSSAPKSATPANQQPGQQDNNQQQQNDNTQPSSDTSQQNSGNQSTSPASAAGNSPGSVSPNSTMPAGLGSGGGGGGAGGGGGGGAFSAPGLGGLGGSTSGSPQSGGRGSSVPGKPAAAAASAAGAANASRGGTSPSAMGGMGQAGRGNSQGDKEHKTSELLHGQHLEEWIGDGEQVMPAYGAIGSQVPSAQSSPDKPPNEPRPQQSPRPGPAQGEFR